MILIFVGIVDSSLNVVLMKLSKNTTLITLFILICNLSFGQERIKDTVGYFTFHEQVRSTIYDFQVAITVDNKGYIYIPISGRSMNIIASFRAEYKDKLLSIVKEFKEYKNAEKLADYGKLHKLSTPITTDAIGFNLSPEKTYAALKTPLNFTYVLHLKELPGSTNNLVIGVPKIEDFFEPKAYIDGYYLYMTAKNVEELEAALKAIP